MTAVTPHKATKLKLPVNSAEIAAATKSILDQDFAHLPTIRRLSQLTRSNVLAVQKAFKHVQGKTILVYTLEKRIERAKQLLLEGELTLDFIAYEIGYASRSVLIKLFRKYVGKRPREWRGK